MPSQFLYRSLKEMLTDISFAHQRGYKTKVMFTGGSWRLTVLPV